MLHHVFGATSVAMSTVLTAFMAGLGLGAYWFGKRSQRMRQPLMVYAICEVAVALIAIAIPLVVRPDGFLAVVNAFLRTTFGADSAAFMFSRFACVFPLLIVPTTLMGGTLPLLSRHFVERTGSADRASALVGALYAVNTFGAVCGTLLGNFVLMPTIGVYATNLVAVGMNLLLAVLIFAFRARLTPHAEQLASGQVRVGESAEVQPLEARSAELSPFVRRVAVWTFGVSGACALAYEVVWSRALSMAIGSSMQSFALILVTFLLGIAGGSALISSELSPRPRTSSLGPMLGHAVAAVLLALLALSPAFLLSQPSFALAGFGIAVVCTVIVMLGARERARRDQLIGGDPRSGLEQASLILLALPCAIALIECVRFGTRTSTLSAAAQHGYLPFIAASVVLLIAGFLAIGILLKHRLLLLAGCMQLAIALSTFVSYLFQDEIPYAFARMVSSVRDLPEHVGTVRFFMFLAAGLCTLPATLGMGAMFPITLRIWSSGGERVGEDVGVVYSANTLGSICGAWLPGFVLMPLVGMEATLHAGMLINAALSALLLGLDIRVTRRAAQRSLDLDLARPWLARGLLLATTACAAALFFALRDVRSPLRWNLSHMTLGAFRVSLAQSVLNPTSWGEPDLVYYRDGVSTTVSVERWGRHLSLKNNGKVDASNGDDMPTQIMVAAYPLLLHPRATEDLDVVIVGFGSGVTVGAALQFPIRHADVMELEKGVVEAAVDYFSDVNHFRRTLKDFPYLEEPRLALYNDDGRNFLAAANKRYDIIISEPSNPWITGVSDLFTVDHLRISKAKLAPGGLYCQWVQLYEMSPDNIKTIYRTFASQFEHVVAFAAEELSSDTILVGSDAPIAFDLPHLARSLENPTIAKELERAYVHSPYDVLSRTLFASKAEILSFAQREERLVDGKWQHNMRSTGSLPCPAESCRRTPAPLNTDDNMWIELRAPADLIGFSRYEGYLSTFYGPEWPYGELLGRVRGLDTEPERAALALSLMAHGRKPRALAMARALDPAADNEVRTARRTIELLLEDGHEPAVSFEPPMPGPQMTRAMRARFDAAARELTELTRAGHYARALSVMESLPAPLRVMSGPGFRFLYGYLLYEAAGDDRALLKSAIEQLEDSIRRDEVYTRAHPELYYFLARAQAAASSFDKAVRNMRTYVELTSLVTSH